MGAEIKREYFSELERTRFKKRLHRQLAALATLLEWPLLASRQRTMGVELELFLVDDQGRALPVSQEVSRIADSDAITPEIGRIDIELSTPPVALAGASYSRLRRHMHSALDQLQAHAKQFGARAVPVSILPTLRREDFGMATITDLPRYRALASGLARARHAPFHICIDGDDALQMTTGDAAMESANTAFQVHLSVAPSEFARMFNAAMLVTAPVLAASGNSPTFLGHRLWQETRIALFKQAGDDRPPHEGDGFRMPSRFGFGNGWVREGAFELFAESVALHEPLLCECRDEEDPLEAVGAGRLPSLWELRLHHGTIWRWNRPVYDPAGSGHLRIELRALPAGPSVDDMLGNAAFFVGAILALSSEVQELLPSMPFALAERNFYRAAQQGLRAELAWPKRAFCAPRAMTARDVLLELIPRARVALLEVGVDAADVDRYLGLFEVRVRSGTTGAVWQRQAYERLVQRGMPKDAALATMLAHYMQHSASGLPVASWPALA